MSNVLVISQKWISVTCSFSNIWSVLSNKTQLYKKYQKEWTLTKLNHAHLPMEGHWYTLDILAVSVPFRMRQSKHLSRYHKFKICYLKTCSSWFTFFKQEAPFLLPWPNFSTLVLHFYLLWLRKKNFDKILYIFSICRKCTLMYLCIVTFLIYNF